MTEFRLHKLWQVYQHNNIIRQFNDEKILRVYLCKEDFKWEFSARFLNFMMKFK